MTEKWIDISQPLQNGIAEWPGDTPFSYEVAFTKAIQAPLISVK